MAEEEEREEYFNLLLSLVVDIGTDVLLKIFEKKIPEKENYESFLKANEKKIRQLKKHNIINDAQLCIISNVNIENFDISLLFTLLRNLTNIEEPLGGWNIACPRSSDNSEGACLIRLKLVRNEAIGHVGSTTLKKTRFEKFWVEAKKSLIVLAGTVSHAECLSVNRRIRQLENKLLKDDNDIRENLKKLAMWDLEDKYSNLQQKLSDQNVALDDIKNMVRDIQADIEQIKQSSIGGFPQHNQVQPAESPVHPSMPEDQDVRNQINQISQAMQSFVMSFYSGNEMANRQNNCNEPPITNPTAMSNDEIIEASQKIGGNWQIIATYLGFTDSQQDALRFNYNGQLETLLLVMLRKWHAVVARTNEDVKLLLASAYAQIRDYRAAGDILQDNNRVEELRNSNPKPKPSPETERKIRAISFSKHPPVPNITVNIGGPNSFNSFNSTQNFYKEVTFGNGINQYK